MFYNKNIFFFSSVFFFFSSYWFSFRRLACFLDPRDAIDASLVALQRPRDDVFLSRISLCAFKMGFSRTFGE